MDGSGYLYAGGNFTTAGGVTANRVAKWDGSAWSPLGSGMNAYVYTLASTGTALIAGGVFTSASVYPSYFIGYWNKTSIYLPTQCR